MSLANHVQEFDPCQYLGRRLKGVETKHGSGDFFDGAGVLSGDVVEVCYLADPYCNGFVFADLFKCGFVGTALVFSHLVRNLTGTHGFFEKPYGCLHLAADSQQKVNGPAALVCGTTTVLALVIGLDLVLLHCPTPAHWALVFTKYVFQQWQEPYLPAADG